ncbi:PucR family transcriptional regulator [Rugosimonospora africana]|uniref:PucR C-terminal helix-turn-helix domain-containing protein n=1 Tax=Rugosimonospora africana TaxID=556532 RepID=A0A8J3VSQ2_9ACTN|nr:PucR family transcriptional regulator [Rugosimonospora africana]GIH16856.1 hypothetical protein Raf01_50280 [Rugosimonospora africana]
MPARQTVATSMRLLVRNFELDLDTIVTQDVESIRERVDLLGRLSLADLVPGTRTLFEHAAAAVRELREPTGAELRSAAAVAALRAEQGIPSDTILLGMQLHVSDALVRAVRYCRASDLPEGVLTAFTGALHQWSATVSTRFMSAHRATLERLAGPRRGQRDVVDQLLHGRLKLAELSAAALSWLLEPGSRVYAVRAHAPTQSGRRRLRDALVRHGGPGVLEEIEGDVCGVLTRPPTGLADHPIAVAGPAPLWDVPACFGQATEVLAAARAFGRTGTVTRADLALELAMLRCGDLGEALAGRIDPFLDALPNTEELESTVQRWLLSGLDVVATAESLHVHPNTVRYRLRRFAEVTGMALDHPRTRTEVMWALNHRNLRGRQPRPVMGAA